MFLLLPYSMSTMVHGCVNSQPHCKYKCTLYLATYSVQHTLPIQIKNVTAHLHENWVQSALSVKLGMWTKTKDVCTQHT